MSTHLQSAFDLLRSFKTSSGIKVTQNFEDFFASRLVQACTEETLLDMAERLAKTMDVTVDYIGGKRTVAFMQAAASPAAPAILQWIRNHTRIAAMIAALRDDDDYREALASIDLPTVAEASGTAPPRGKFGVAISVVLQSPLAHGGDCKAGNATLFRRGQVLSTTGKVLDLPFYAGNAIRGQMRDLLADDFIAAMGLKPSKSQPPIALWFFHALYAGGVLETGGAMRELIKQLGDNGAIRADGVSQFRERLPALSALGVAMGNRVLCGRVSVADLRPRCVEWGTGDTPAAALMEWTFLTRREDHEAHTDHHGMIANSECLRTGVLMDGGLDIDTHASDLERSAIGWGLQLLRQRGMLGAENRRGLGKVEFDYDGQPDPLPYLQWLAANRADIIDYLNSIGALDVSGNQAILDAGAAKKAPKPKKSKAAQSDTESNPAPLDDPIPFDDQVNPGSVNDGV